MSNLIAFRSNSQMQVWKSVIVPEISEGLWAKSTMHKQKLFIEAKTEVSSEVGTDIPLFELRFDLIKDEFLFDKGWKIIALTRLSIIYGSKGVKTIPDCVISLIDHIIAIDFADANKDYRRSQVRSVTEIFCRVSNYNKSGKQNFELLVEDAKGFGFALEGIIEALKINVFDKSDLNKDITDMMKILKTSKFQ